MNKFWRTITLPTVALPFCAAMLSSAPTAATAQEAPVAAQEAPVAQEMKVDREQMTRFARAHLAINTARDEFHGEVARVHDEEGRLRAREKVEAAISEILEAQGLTHEEFDDLTLMISLDGDLRAMFDEIVAELQAEGSGGA